MPSTITEGVLAARPAMERKVATSLRSILLRPAMAMAAPEPVCARAIERIQIVDGREIRRKDIVRAARGIFRLRGVFRFRREQFLRSDLRGAAKIVKRHHATDDSGQRRGNLRVACVGDVL